MENQHEITKTGIEIDEVKMQIEENYKKITKKIIEIEELKKQIEEQDNRLLYCGHCDYKHKTKSKQDLIATGSQPSLIWFYLIFNFKFIFNFNFFFNFYLILNFNFILNFKL